MSVHLILCRFASNPGDCRDQDRLRRRQSSRLLDKVGEGKEMHRKVALARCADLNTLAESAT
jgi:hypothetical protein